MVRLVLKDAEAARIQDLLRRTKVADDQELLDKVEQQVETSGRGGKRGDEDEDDDDDEEPLRLGLTRSRH